jgi:hypothetical protein
MTTPLSPGEFCRLALRALDSSAGRSRRRKRDQTPDTLGLGIKRDLLERAAEADPPSGTFEEWLMQQVLTAPVSGPVRAMCVQILDEYRAAQISPNLSEWLLQGAPSADADVHGDARPKSDAEVGQGALNNNPTA